MVYIGLLIIWECGSIYLYPLSQYNSVYDVAISGDQSGMLEYWAGPAQDYGFPKSVKFEYKTDTDLYEFIKVRIL